MFINLTVQLINGIFFDQYNLSIGTPVYTKKFSLMEIIIGPLIYIGTIVIKDWPASQLDLNMLQKRTTEVKFSREMEYIPYYLCPDLI